MLGQLIGLFASMRCGLKPDQPSPGGTITRVVAADQAVFLKSGTRSDLQRSQLLHCGMVDFVRLRHQLAVDVVGHVAVPVSGGLRVSDDSEKQDCDSCGHRPGGRRPSWGERVQCGKDICSAPSDGQTATHSRHPVHSADLIVTSLSTGNEDGQAFAHFAQSMQRLAERRIRNGLSREVNPSNAP